MILGLKVTFSEFSTHSIEIFHFQCDLNFPSESLTVPLIKLQLLHSCSIKDVVIVKG